MKKTKIIYWVLTILFAGFMIFSSVPNIIMTEQVREGFKGLGYPLYIVPFLGVAKILGCIGILIPGFPRIKEWAYAGLMFDLIGATYSMIALKTPFMMWSFMILPLLIGTLSYIYYHKKLKYETTPARV